MDVNTKQVIYGFGSISFSIQPPNDILTVKMGMNRVRIQDRAFMPKVKSPLRKRNAFEMNDHVVIVVIVKVAVTGGDNPLPCIRMACVSRNLWMNVHY